MGQELTAPRRGALSHVEINVSNLAVSSEFWGWLLARLGYEHHQQWELGRSWRLNGTYIVIVQTEEPFAEAGYHRKNTGLNHLAFHAESAEDVDALAAALGAKGIPILYPDRHPHAGGDRTYAVYFEDPDRIKIEFVATSA